jgi:predicted nucleotidyltransferase
MTQAPEEIAVRALYEEMRRITARVPASRWFFFGSITTTKRPVGDIDLLVVCKTTCDCATVRAELASICERFPIHLLLMTLIEEAEVKFIQSECAVDITSAGGRRKQHRDENKQGRPEGGQKPQPPEPTHRRPHRPTG